MQINNIQVVDRNARPSVLSKVALRTFFVNNGEFIDPYAISSVSVYHAAANQSPSGILEVSSGVISSGHYSDAVMVFGVSTAINPSGSPDDTAAREAGTVVKTNGVVRESFKEREYTGQLGPNDATSEDTNRSPASGVSGVYRINTGEYAVVLDGGISLSGLGHDGAVVTNSANTVGDYIDVWTVKLTENSEWNTYINSFKLFSDTLYTLTEPLLLRTTNKLINKRVTMGSKVDLKITTEMTVENKNIDQNIKNAMKDIGLQNITVEIEKINDTNGHLPSRVRAKNHKTNPATFADPNITSDNTIVYTLDTAELGPVTAGAFATDDAEFGSKTGTYHVFATYTVLNQTIKTPPMVLIVT